MGGKCISGLTVLIMLSCGHQPNEKEILNNIKQHYDQKSDSELSISYKQIGFNPYQSYDYRNPDSLVSFHKVQLTSQSFFAERIARFPGGFEFGLKEFQQDSIGYRYDLNGILLGKRAIKQPKSRIEKVSEELTQLIDFRFSQQLFSAGDEVAVDTLDFTKNLATLIKVNEVQDTLRITYQIEPIMLRSVFAEATQEKWLFQKTNGETFANEIQYYKNGSLKRLHTINRVNNITSIAQEHLSIPEDISISSPAKVKPSIEKIGSNLYLVKSMPGNRNILFATNPNGITVFGAPISDQFSHQVIGLIQSKFPDSKIREVYVTHAHSDHIGGLKAYADIRTTILTDAHGIAAIKSFPRFKSTVDSFVFKAITSGEEIGNATFFVIENTHCKGQGFVYFENNKTIYEGDFLEIPADNTLPSYVPVSTKEFMRFIRDNNLSVKRIVAHHNNDNISMELFHEYYETKK